MSSLLNLDANGYTPESLDPAYLKGFFYFVGLQLLQCLSAMKFDQNIAYTVESIDSLPEETSLCCDIFTELKEKKLFSRLIISSAFKKAWTARYALQPHDLLVESSIAQRIKVPVHIEAGFVVLPQIEWKKITVGDVLILDHCTIQPNLSKIKVLLTVKGKTYFRARFKKGSLKILEFPLIHQTGEEMKDEEYDEDFNEIETDYGQTDEGEAEEPLMPSQPNASFTQAEASLVNVSNIPLKIVVELGRIQMSVQQLVSLQPGNVLELDIDPEQGVDLVVNGSKIARGELLKIGEHFGVRILECG